SATPAPPAHSRCVVDARQMERWGLSDARLPPDCTIAFRTPSLWDSYRWHVVIAATLILLQAILIYALLRQLRRRRAAEFEPQRKSEELAHAARLATVRQLTAAIP